MESSVPTFPDGVLKNAQKTQLEVGLPGLFGTKYPTESCNFNPRSQTPPPNAELIEHCVVTKEENANTVSCRCLPVTTKIDSKTGQMVVVCKKMPEEN